MISYSVLYVTELKHFQEFQLICQKVAHDYIKQLKQKLINNFDNLDQFFWKGNFWTEKEKMNIIIEFSMLELAQVPNFTLNKQFWIPEPNLLNLLYFQWYPEKVNITIKVAYSD